MGSAFNEADHLEQVNVCEGRTSPWSVPCPVKDECLLDLIRRVDKYGWRELNDGDLVAGGLRPSQLRKVVYAVRSKKSPPGYVQTDLGGVG